MRVTNMMLANNSMIHTGKSKERYMNAMEKYMTGKRIQRPSDDPVIAVRSLKYRSNLYELTQYLDKNIPDAFSWMDVTEGAMSQIQTRLTRMNELCTQGANGPLSLEDLNGIIEELQQYKEFIYEQQLNTDFAGRYVFTGYRTNTPMLFDSVTTNLEYTITEKHVPGDISKFTYVYGGAEYDAGNDKEEYAEMAPDLLSGFKLNLGYGNLVNEADSIQLIDASGNPLPYTIEIASVNDGPPYNDAYNVDADKVNFIPETGELIFGKNVYEDLIKSDGFQVTYSKTEFEKGDIRPEHYFDCTVYDTLKDPLKVDPSVYSSPEEQNIRYEINFSQTLTVNTLGCNVIGHGIGRMMDEISNTAYSLQQSMTKLEEAKKKLESEDPNNAGKVEALNELIEQINNEISLKEKVLQDLFGRGLTVTSDAEQKISIALANHGARYTRLQMTENKLKDQETQFTEILSENEEIDLEEATIKYYQADMLYQASLTATSKILGNSLLNFI